MMIIYAVLQDEIEKIARHPLVASIKEGWGPL